MTVREQCRRRCKISIESAGFVMGSEPAKTIERRPCAYSYETSSAFSGEATRISHQPEEPLADCGLRPVFQPSGWGEGTACFRRCCPCRRPVTDGGRARGLCWGDWECATRLGGRPVSAERGPLVWVQRSDELFASQHRVLCAARWQTHSISSSDLHFWRPASAPNLRVCAPLPVPLLLGSARARPPSLSRAHGSSARWCFWGLEVLHCERRAPACPPQQVLLVCHLSARMHATAAATKRRALLGGLLTGRHAALIRCRGRPACEWSEWMKDAMNQGLAPAWPGSAAPSSILRTTVFVGAALARSRTRPGRRLRGSTSRPCLCPAQLGSVRARVLLHEWVPSGRPIDGSHIADGD
jgi:hypothetical protein